MDVPSKQHRSLPSQSKKDEARELFRMFDEFFSYTKGFLDHDAFVEWMRWRQFDHCTQQDGKPNLTIVFAVIAYGWLIS